MRIPRRLAAIALVAGTLVTVLATPAAAQSVNRAAIDELNTQLLYVALPLVLFVELTLVYAVCRFRDNDDPSPTTDDPVLELTWTAATAVVLVFVGVSGYFVLTNPYVTPAAAGDAAADLEIEVVAYQWGWQFHYPAANVTTQGRVVLPVDTDVRFVVASADVVHSLYVPALGIKQDALPGQEQIARTNATATGEYDLYCAEFCGAGHSRMHGTVVVLPRTAYEAWLAERRGEPTNATAARPPPAEAGAAPSLRNVRPASS